MQMIIIMHGFENEHHQNEFWFCLKNKKIPLKFAYSGNGAYLHDKFANSINYQQNVGSINIEINEIIKKLKDYEKPLQICDIGPGNGIRSIAFLKSMIMLGYRIDRYTLFDFSSTLLKLSLNKIKDSFPEVSIYAEIWDFERGCSNSISKFRKDLPLLVLFNGLTLCNVENPSEVLKNLYSSCDRGDIFFLEIALLNNQNPDKYLNGYQSEIFLESALETIKMAGINPRVGDFKLFFSNLDSAIIGEFVIHEKTRINYKSEEIIFIPGDRIRCFISRRFELNAIKKLLVNTGWNVQKITYDNLYQHAILISKKG